MASRRSETPTASRARKPGACSPSAKFARRSWTIPVSNRPQARSLPNHTRRLKMSDVGRGVERPRSHQSSRLASGLLGFRRIEKARPSAKQDKVAVAFRGKIAKSSPSIELFSRLFSSNIKAKSALRSKATSGLKAAPFERLGDPIIKNARASDKSGQTTKKLTIAHRRPWQSDSPVSRRAWTSAVEGFGSADLPLRAGGLSAWDSSAAEDDDSSHTLGRSDISDSNDDSSEEEGWSSEGKHPGLVLKEKYDNAAAGESSDDEDSVEDPDLSFGEPEQSNGEERTSDDESSASEFEDFDLNNSLLGGIIVVDDDLSDMDE